jgi:ABC-2 type transport system ATP-binding protein
MEPAIRIEGLTKVFPDGWGKASFTALQDTSLEVAKGQIFGVFGGNGSGKSTLLKLCCGLLQKSGGEIGILGLEPKVALRHDLIGYLPERPRYPDYSTPRKLLGLFGKLSGFSGDSLEKRISECLDICLLNPLAEIQVRKLSKGGIQRLALAQALIHDPKVLVLDEPVDGLDPLACEGVATILGKLRDDGKTVLLSTHFVAGLEGLCDQVLVLDRGCSLYLGPPDFEDGFQPWLLKKLKEGTGVW